MEPIQLSGQINLSAERTHAQKRNHFIAIDLKCSSCLVLMANFVLRFARGRCEAANLGERSAGGSGSGEAQKQFAAGL